MIYVAQVSSLYPIDLAATLYAGISERTAQFRIYLSDVAELPMDPSVRKYVARGALPSCSWSLDKGRVWRQHYIPLEEVKEASKFADLLTMVGHTLIDGAQMASAGIMERCTQLAEAAARRGYRSAQKWRSDWAPFIAGIIEEIVAQVIGAQVTVQPYWQFRLGQYDASPIHRMESRRAFQRLLLHALKVFPNSLVFTQGGQLEVEMENSLPVWQRFSALSFDGENIEFSRSEGDKRERLQIGLHDPPNVRFRGPLEILQLQEIGTLVHLPWYADARFWTEESTDYTGIEFISPISSNSKNRASSESGGGGYRLYPTGYSLIEFESPAIFRLIQEKLKIPPISAKELIDWLGLIRQLPAVSQKISKDQHAMSAFRNLREVESKRRISQGDISSLHVLHREIDTLNPLLYGQYLIELLALIALLKEWSSPACPNPVPFAITQQLKQLNWVDSDSILLAQNIVSLVNASILTICSWLASHGWHFSEDNVKQRDAAIQTLLQRGNRSLKDRREHSPAGFGLVMRVLRELIDVYYSFAAFCCGALFKAHILFPFLLLGPDEYRSEIERLLKLRSEIYRLFFDPILWIIA